MGGGEGVLGPHQGKFAHFAFDLGLGDGTRRIQINGPFACQHVLQGLLCWPDQPFLILQTYSVHQEFLASSIGSHSFILQIHY